MPLAYFAIIGPMFIVAFHVFALLMTKGLREKNAVWEERLRDAVRINKDRERLRQRLDTSLLALTQMAFLPYQSVFITDIQRALLLIDGVAVVALWTAGIGSLVLSVLPLVALAIPSWFILVFPERPRSPCEECLDPSSRHRAGVRHAPRRGRRT
jgi:hypothetical protein